MKFAFIAYWKHGVKLNLVEVRRFDKLLGELMTIEPEVDSLLARPWVTRYLRRVGFAFGWADAYDLSFSEQLSLLLVVSGQAEPFIALLKGATGFGPVLDYAESYAPEGNELKPKRWRIIVCLLVLKALLRNIACISYYSKGMSELVREGVAGDLLSLRRAVAVDPTVLSSPSVSAYLARLSLTALEREVRAIYTSATKGPNRQLDPYRRLRYLERVLREGNVFSEHGREAVFKLIADEMRLYDGRRGDPFKALFTLFDRWNKEATT